MSPFRIIKRITCFFTISVIFWSISRIYFLFFSMQNIESKIRLFLSNLFQVIFFWWKIYSFPVMFIYKSFNFSYSFRVFSYFFMISWFNATVMLCYCNATVMKAFIIFFIDGIYCCLFVFYPIRRICIWFALLKIYFMTFTI